MSAILSVFSIRVSFILLGILSVVTIVVTVAPSTQPLVDPFAPYMNIMPGQPSANVFAHGFQCQINVPVSSDESCILSKDAGTFSEIQTTIAYRTGLVSRLVFIPHIKALLFGHLVRLWGKPQTAVYGQTVNFRWPNMHAVTVIRNYLDRLSYWLPVTYIAFDSLNYNLPHPCGLSCRLSCENLPYSACQLTEFFGKIFNLH